jgi:glutaminase
MLAKVDPELFGVSVCTIDGRQFSVGDSSSTFSMQSCAAPLAYAVAAEDRGLNTIHRYVGFSPSGSAFNDVSLDKDGKPWNPYLNSGAIAVGKDTTCMVLLTQHPS